MRVCFVTDGGQQLGMGHVQESLAFAQRLRERASVEFLTKSGAEVQETIRQAGFRTTPAIDDAGILSHLAMLDPDTVVFDKIDVAEELAKQIRTGLRAKLVIFTNLTAANRHADIAVLQRAADLGVSVEDRFRNVTFVDSGTRTRYFYGPRYWILRPELFGRGGAARTARRGVGRILISFGGSDPSKLTPTVLEAILSMEEDYRVELVLGAFFGEAGAIERVVERYPHRRPGVVVHRNVSNMVELMRSADLMICGAGLSMFEALTAGLPIVVVPQNELQRATYDGWIDFLDSSDLGRLPEVIRGSMFTLPTDENIAKMEIGLGVDELIEAVLQPSIGRE